MQSHFTSILKGLPITIGLIGLFSSFTLLHSDEKSTSPEPVDFLKSVKPILEARCFECHNETKKRGGLRLDSIRGILQGGSSGSILIAEKGTESLLIRHVTGTGGVERMPPKGDPLTKEQIDILRLWIQQGAKLPAINTKEVANSDEVSWAFLPLKKVPIPELGAEGKKWARNPIDAFIWEKLAAQKLKPSAEADRRTLARRVSFDLTGLPPLPEELENFLNDSSADAYEKWVDKLLDSPRYGERYARHWLDVAHYADSHGHDQDRFRPHAWPYRDYLIRSFNSDKPYARFVKEQVAGDVLFPDDPQAIIATGFLAAGPWDESGLRDINENSLDRQIARYLDRDDIVTTTMSTFVGLTVHCARCHDHKFDPISQKEYYALQAVFAGIDKAERAFDNDPKVAKQRLRYERERSLYPSLKTLAELEKVNPDWRATIKEFEKSQKDNDGGWVVVKPHRVKSMQGSILKCLDDHSILATGKTPPVDTYILEFTTDQIGWTALKLELICDDSLPFKGPGRAINGNLHLNEIRVKIAPKDKPKQFQSVKIKKALADFSQQSWEIDKAIDNDPKTAWGIHPEEGKPHLAIFEFENPVGFAGGTEIRIELEQSHGREHLIGRFRVAMTNAIGGGLIHQPLPAVIESILKQPEPARTESQQLTLAQYVLEKKLASQLASLPPQTKVYCGTNRFTPEGSFRPKTQPEPIYLLKRGEITRKGELVDPAALRAVKSLRPDFHLTNPQDEGERRAKLAEWLADENNPLTWRVIVNRIWHYHFGKGIVDTPSDFGKMGGQPTHPELLDWLAEYLKQKNGSLKALHRLIVTSSTYRQAVLHNEQAAKIDSDNRLLWRMNRTRMDAETFRDTVLCVSGRLDETQFGPPVKHFLTKPGVHVTLDADYDKLDLDSPEARRRSIYRFIFRTRADPMLEALDCPDASLATPTRTTSVNALQSLVLWNNRFVLKQCEHLASLAQSRSAELEKQVLFVTQRILGRNPQEQESVAWTGYARKHGLANLVRVLFNSSEFLFID